MDKGYESLDVRSPATLGTTRLVRKGVDGDTLASKAARPCLVHIGCPNSIRITNTSRICYVVFGIAGDVQSGYNAVRLGSG